MPEAIPLLEEARREFHASLLKTLLTRDAQGVVSNADKDNDLSVAVANGIADKIGATVSQVKLAGQMSGSKFETLCREYVAGTFCKLGHLRPGNWIVEKVSSKKKLAIAAYAQYAHLHYLAEAAKKDAKLAAALGSDYTITPDIVVARLPEPDEVLNGAIKVVTDSTAIYALLRKSVNVDPILHATISCKWTLRSDRAQNARTEGLNLVRHRKGHTPHIAVVTGEPLPTRLASLAYGTGDIDCVYHFALPELIATIQELNMQESADLLRNMVDGRRMKDITDLPLDIAI